MKESFTRSVIRGALLLPLIFLAACGSPPPEQFREFAQLGPSPTRATPPLLDAAFSDAVKADSLVLAQSREEITDRKERLAALNTSNELLKSRLVIYGDLIK